MKDISKTILEERSRQGLTQSELGRDLRMSRNTIAGLEKGTFKEVGIRKVEAVLNRLGYTLTVKKIEGRPTLNDLQQRNFHDE